MPGLRDVRAVQLEDVPRGSFDRSVSSGTEVCIRNAISYCAMRVSISGSPKLVELHLVQLGRRASSIARRVSRVDAGRVR